MSPAETPSSDSLVFREGSEEQVSRLLETRDSPLTAGEAVALLANPNCTWRVLEALSANRDLLTDRRILVAMIRHPETPTEVARRWIPTLFWKELLDVTLTLKARPATRRWCEKALKERLLTMGLGEKITLARRAPAGLIPSLRKEKSVMVIEALLDNPRMTQSQVEVVVNDPTTPADVLILLSRESRWMSQRRVRIGLIKNSSTPLGTALGLLTSLSRSELRELVRHPALNHAIKVACERILERR